MCVCVLVNRMVQYHQTCNSSNNLLSHHGSFGQEEPTSLQTQPSLRSIPSLTSELQLQQHQFPTAHHQCIATLKGQSSYTSSLFLAGKFLLTGSSDKEIRLWRRNDLKPLNQKLTGNVVTAGQGAVKSLVVSADKLFSAHQDHKIRVWKIYSDKAEKQKLTHLATLPKLSDHVLNCLNPKNHVQVRRHKKCIWVQHVDTVSALALSTDESHLYSVSWDRTLKIWRTTDFKCLESVANAHDDAINAVALSTHGHVYTGSADKKIKVWRKGLGQKKHSLVATLERHKSGVNALALSADGSVLYSGACDRSILVWEKDDGSWMLAVGALKGHTKSILCLAVVSNLVCSGSADKTVRIWTGVERSYSCLAVLEGHTGPVKCLTMAKDHSNTSDAASSFLLYSSSLDCDTKIWQILTVYSV